MKGCICSPKRSYITSPDKAEIAVRCGKNKKKFWFKKHGWHYKVFDSSGDIIIYSQFDTKSIWNRILGIAPLVFYNNENKEILRFNNHMTFKKHEIVFDKNQKIEYDHRKYEIVWNNNKAFLNNENKSIEFECDEENMLKFIIISLKIWNSYNQPS